MRKYTFIFLGFAFILGFFVLNANLTNASSVPDCSSVSGYRLTQGASCKTSVNSPIVLNFKAKDPGGSNLSWSINWGDGKGVPLVCPSSFPNNTFSVSHTWSTVGTYNVKLNVSNCKGGVAVASFNIIVELPVISASLEAVPSSLGYGGGPSTIFVHTAGATSCYVPSTSDMKEYIDPMTYKTIPLLTNYISFSSGMSVTGENKSAGDGASIKVSPTTATTYNISCTGPGGTVNNSVRITIDPNASVTAKLSIDPLIIPIGGDATLSWSSTGAQYCIADGQFDGNGKVSNTAWTGKKDTSGTFKISNFSSNGSGSFRITCFGTGGKKDSTWAMYDISSSSATNDAFGLSGKFKILGGRGVIHLSWNPVLSLGYIGGYKIYKSGKLIGAVQTYPIPIEFSTPGAMTTPTLENTTSFDDDNNGTTINCPSVQAYKVVPYSGTDVSGPEDWNSSSASQPATVVVKYPCSSN